MVQGRPCAPVMSVFRYGGLLRPFLSSCTLGSKKYTSAALGKFLLPLHYLVAGTKAEVNHNHDGQGLLQPCVMRI